ncbi:MAG: GNAT family N-acetyltransferase [Spirochaetia bacterium]|nr:GNAT family N-acetyltransferase [Spirochaetia bacterium]
MTNKQLYQEFYEQHPDICIFSAPWWLDATAGAENWDVILVRNKNNEIIATFPYTYKKGKFGLKQIGMPTLTQKLGPYIVYDKNKITETKKITYEHEIYTQIIDQLPDYDSFMINFDQRYKNWLPFYWNGFNQTTRYSYRIENIKNHDLVFGNYAKSKKQKIQKAKNFTLKYDMDFNAFYDYFEEVIKERNEKVSYSKEFFINLCEAVYKNNAGRIFYCEDEDKNIHAINLTVWDNDTAYYLIAMRKQNYNMSGGTEFLVHETIKYVSEFVDVFDFEGSMLKGVEQSYRLFGGEQTEYYSISHTKNKLLALYHALRS